MPHLQIARPDDTMLRSPLLLVDDSASNIRLLERTLEWGGYLNVKSCTSAKEALSAMNTYDPHLIILDLMMPEMNGYEFLEIVRRDVPIGTFLPILIFTADMNPDSKIRALEAGASDFLTKPGDAVEIRLRVKNFLQTRHLQSKLQNHNEILEARVIQRTEHLAVARKEAVDILARACEYRDDATGVHARRVGELSAEIASTLDCGPEFIESIRLAASLHDIGKIAIPDGILHKPSSLTDEEYLCMKQHTHIGFDMIGEVASPLLEMAKDIVLNHHEHWDGNGYGRGIAGEAIPLCARIVSVADAFDAITNDRPYRKKQSADQAMREISKMSGTQFDPTVVEALQRFLNPVQSETTRAA